MPARKTNGERLIAIETTLTDATEDIKQMLKILQGDNGQGLMTRVALVEEHPENCPAKTSIKWLTWGFRLIVAALIGSGIASAIWVF